MKRISAALFILLGLASAALAQTVSIPQPNAGTYGAYNASAPTCVDGSGCWFQTDVNGNMKITLVPSSGTAAGISPVSSSALAANTVIKASAGNLYSFQVSADSTLSAAAWWVMVYDATAAPVDGAVTPKKCYAMPSGATALSAAFPNATAFATGIVIGVSTTGCFTKTASTHAFISGDAK
jgi:hypothetical protein